MSAHDARKETILIAHSDEPLLVHLADHVTQVTFLTIDGYPCPCFISLDPGDRIVVERWNKEKKSWIGPGSGGRTAMRERP